MVSRNWFFKVTRVNSCTTGVAEVVRNAFYECTVCEAQRVFFCVHLCAARMANIVCKVTVKESEHARWRKKKKDKLRKHEVESERTTWDRSNRRFRLTPVPRIDDKDVDTEYERMSFFSHLRTPEYNNYAFNLVISDPHIEKHPIRLFGVVNYSLKGRQT